MAWPPTICRHGIARRGILHGVDSDGLACKRRLDQLNPVNRAGGPTDHPLAFLSPVRNRAPGRARSERLQLRTSLTGLFPVGIIWDVVVMMFLRLASTNRGNRQSKKYPCLTFLSRMVY